MYFVAFFFPSASFFCGFWCHFRCSGWTAPGSRRGTVSCPGPQCLGKPAALHTDGGDKARNLTGCWDSRSGTNSSPMRYRKGGEVIMQSCSKATTRRLGRQCGSDSHASSTVPRRRARTAFFARFPERRSGRPLKMPEDLTQVWQSLPIKVKKPRAKAKANAKPNAHDSIRTAVTTACLSAYTSQPGAGRRGASRRASTLR